ncbi:4-hydroxy-3-methylbut-2-enyl diphosphate reductase [Methylococcus mesophilus]|uniref:4-hydroxy-3-methylbut-2-enyl diphosphate reductase n=1 Tax=Methylococcus mesophilus TaxID=2993564 RepID=UPI00224A6DEE|nr:4-hydroxy-3-methylbut-2-enyl diphosphate reductase [Methylococcus mesophilus]UZR29914.1 4-hydroxy-3-methylbut-2-enyl diphosphate reductase [Methylococcus mesophilus]
MEIILANPRGFCAGVDRAIEIVDRAIEVFGAPIYVRHEVVHNRYVVDGLRDRGAVFVEELSEVPENSTVIFSAHGVSKQIQEEARQRGLQVFDATCPLVTKVHIEVHQHANEGREIVFIGHAGHPEVEGTMGQYDNPAGGIYLVESPEDVEQLQVKNPDNVAYVTQTTLSIDDTGAVVEALKARFPKILGPRKDDICYATQNRQDAVKKLAAQCDTILVVGSPNSSNSNRLREIADKLGRKAFLIDNAGQLTRDMVAGAERIGVTAGASAPEILVQQVIAQLKEWGGRTATETRGIEEKVVFSLPKELRRLSA